MFFRLETTLRELLVNLGEGESLDFDYNGPHHITASLRIPTADEQRIGHQKENAFCTTASSWEPPSDIVAAFTSLCNRLTW